jgi:hypothetical protein
MRREEIGSEGGRGERRRRACFHVKIPCSQAK